MGMFETLQKSGLIVINGREESKMQGRKFLIDHPTRAFYAVGTREAMMEILSTIHQYDPEHKGFYSLFLSLVARRSLLNAEKHIFIQWLRPYHIENTQTPEDWISMSEWLELDSNKLLMERTV